MWLTRPACKEAVAPEAKRPVFKAHCCARVGVGARAAHQVYGVEPSITAIKPHRLEVYDLSVTQCTGVVSPHYVQDFGLLHAFFGLRFSGQPGVQEVWVAGCSQMWGLQQSLSDRFRASVLFFKVDA